MQLIKLAIFSFVSLFVVATAISLLIPSHVRLSKAINIHAPADTILDRVNDTSHWKLWHPAFRDPSFMKKKSAPVLTKGEQSDSLVVYYFQQPGRNPVVNGWKLYQYPHTDSITVQWYMDFKLGWYPWQKFSSLFYENTYGNMMQDGLIQLKTITDK